MSHSAEIGPSRILLSRDLRVLLSAAALEWGKFSELIMADTRLSYREINNECRVRTKKEKGLLSNWPLMVENSANQPVILVFRASSSLSAKVARDPDSSRDSWSFCVSSTRIFFSSAALFSSSTLRPCAFPSSAFNRDTSSCSFLSSDWCAIARAISRSFNSAAPR